MRRLGLESVARVCARHPWLTPSARGVVLACAAAVTVMYLGGALSNEQRFTNDPESARATALVHERFPGDQHTRELVIVRPAAATVDGQEGFGVAAPGPVYFGLVAGGLIAARGRISITPW